jgi:hypothetical protein
MFPRLNCPRDGDVQWRVRSTDLAAYDYFLWGYLKRKVFISKPKTIEELKQRIKEEAAAVPEQMTHQVLEKFEEDWSSF